MAESTNETPDWMIDQGIEIDHGRASLASAIVDLSAAVDSAERAVGSLNKAYDVEITETHAGVTIVNALAQIHVAIAALRVLAPEPGR